MNGRVANSQGRLWMGLILIAIGVVFLLDNLYIIDFNFGRFIGRFWPSILIIIGVLQMITHRGRHATGALFLILIGVFFQVARLHVFDWWNMRNLWPMIMILAGVGMLVSRLKATPGTPGPGGVQEYGGELVNAFVIWGHLERAITSRAFRGGEATAVMGGIELDLRRAEPAQGDQRLNLTAVMGGIEIRVPENWQVVVEGTPLLGSIEDTRKPAAAGDSSLPAAAGGRLLIHGFAMMGGIEVKS